MLRRALQLQRKGPKSFPLRFWKQVYLTTITEGPDLRMAAKAKEAEHQKLSDMTKCSLPHLSSYVIKTLFSQGLLQTAQTAANVKLPARPGCPELRPMSSFVLSLSPPHSVLNIGDDKQEWLSLLHLIATHRPAHLQRDYTTILLQMSCL